MTANAEKAAKSSMKARRSAARLAAVQAVYQILQSDQQPGTVVREFVAHRLGAALDGEEMVLPDGVLFERIVKGVGSRREEIEFLVQERLTERGGDGLRQPETLLLAILLCGAYEMLVHTDIDGPLIVAEYMHVASAFYDKAETGLVNAILDSLKQILR